MATRKPNTKDWSKWDGKIDTFYKERSTRHWAFFCPLCSISRRVPFRPKPGGARHFIQIGITAAFFTCLTWPLFEWKGIVSFVPFWTIFEIVYRLRVRAALVCQACGFDPFLYLIDVPRARAAVQDHWKKKLGNRMPGQAGLDSASAGEVSRTHVSEQSDFGGAPRAES